MNKKIRLLPFVIFGLLTTYTPRTIGHPFSPLVTFGATCHKLATRRALSLGEESIVENSMWGGAIIANVALLVCLAHQLRDGKTDVRMHLPLIVALLIPYVPAYMLHKGEYSSRNSWAYRLRRTIMPYTEYKLGTAFYRDAQTTIDDYLDNERIIPTARLLFEAARSGSKYGVKKLMAKGADPRTTSKLYRGGEQTVVELCEQFEMPDKEIVLLLKQQARYLSSFGEKAALDIAVRKMCEEGQPLSEGRYAVGNLPAELLEHIRTFAAQP